MPSRSKKTNTALRIIGGKLRGRKLSVPVRPGLRPTHDHVRETLFNWLQPVVVDSRCLDAFAGSGALGFEALSRGAASTVLVENDREQAQAIDKNSQALELENAHVIQSMWPGVKLPSGQFDIVFLDPPFNSGLIDVVWNELISQNSLAKNCWVYVEHATDETPIIPTGFSCHREKRTKQVVYGTYQRKQLKV